jgi:hypothetical protein
MTWVVGLQSISCVAIFGDVRVTYGDVESTRFGVRKIHKLNERAAAGFAGSIEIGFSELARLQACAYKLGTGAELPEMIDAWYPDAVGTYEKRYPTPLRACGCEVVLVGMSSKRVTTEDGREIGDSDQARQSWHQTHGSVVRFPNPHDPGAKPERLGNFGASIGCGSEVEAYVTTIRENAGTAILKLRDIGSAAESAAAIHAVLSLMLKSAVERTPVPGVSQHFFGAVLNEEGTFVGTSDYGELGSGPLPPLASSSTELRDLERRLGVPTGGHLAVT